jgi:hypothetical protein
LFLFTCCPLRAFYAAVHSARRSSYRPFAISQLSEVVVARTDTLDRVRYPRCAQLGSYASSDLLSEIRTRPAIARTDVSVSSAFGPFTTSFSRCRVPRPPISAIRNANLELTCVTS